MTKCKSLLKTVRFSAVLLAASTLLTGCNKTLESLFGGLSDSGVVVVSQCPPLKEYTREQTSRAAAELSKLPQGNAVVPLVADYKSLRDACRTK